MLSRLARLTGILVLIATLGLLPGGTSHADHASGPLGAPSAAQIAARLRHTIEIGTTGEYFRLIGKPLTIKDGRGNGTLTAAVGGRYPTADGKGQIVFFWHNTTFLGLSSSYETVAVMSLKSPAPGTFVITYANFRPNDPLCCPSLPPRKVNYGWSGHLLISNSVPPRRAGSPRVKYQP